jgi:LmbE family N-acetylglucosaminyl deacetylase
MIRLIPEHNEGGALTILCLGAHADDIEIGCGGTLLQLIRRQYPLKIYWIVFSAEAERYSEAHQSAEIFTEGCDSYIQIKNYRDGYLPYSGAQIKELFENLKCSICPDLIFTHWQGDAHQDHRFVCDLTWNTFRDHLIFEYEIPKYDGDLGRPNMYYSLDRPVYEKKIDYLFEKFQSQQSKSWFARDTFLSLMRLRGVESRSLSGYAEGFYARKVIISTAS